MSSVFLSPEISIELFLEFSLLLVLTFAFIQSISLLKYTKGSNTQEESYEIEKKSYLTQTLISVSLGVKIILLFFFIYALDELSDVISGAMCVSGVLESNIYATPLLLLKLTMLLAISLWLMIKEHKNKIIYFIIIYIFFVIEFILSLSFLSSIDVSTKVSCCSAKFVLEKNTIPFDLSSIELFYVFIASYFSLLLSAFFRKKILVIFTNLFFIYVAYYALIYYFSEYIYFDGNHKCPFCMLKGEYNFLGYFIYTFLFLSTLYSLSINIFNDTNKYKMIILFSSLIVSILLGYLFVNILF